MKKKIQLATITAAITLVFSTTAFAAGWEQTESGAWSYVDEDGNKVTGAWKGLEDGRYYFDDKGYLETDTLVDFGGDLYYVDEEGRMVTNVWKKAMSIDDEKTIDWYYFGSNGKAYKGSDSAARPRDVGGQKYIFDEDGHMLYGWVNADGTQQDDNGPGGLDDPWKEGVYYCGTEDDGHVHIGWYKEGGRWFYFKSAGRKAANEKLTIKNEKGEAESYRFDKNGVRITNTMVSKNVVVNMGDEDDEDEASDIDNTRTRTNTYYYGKDGITLKSQWINTVPTATQNEADNADGIKRWFYADSNGRLVTNRVKEIDGKWYCFDESGIMRSGLLVLEKGKYAYTLHNPNADDDITASREILEEVVDNGERVVYFDPVSGARVSGKVKIELDDGTYDFLFDDAGNAVTGVKKDHLYYAGILMKNYNDEDGKLHEYTVNGKAYTVNNSGKLQKKKK